MAKKIARKEHEATQNVRFVETTALLKFDTVKIFCNSGKQL